MPGVEIIVLTHKVQLISACICQLNLKNSRCSLHPNGCKPSVNSNDNRCSVDCHFGHRMSASCSLNPLFSVVSFITVSYFLCYIQKRDVHFPCTTTEIGGFQLRGCLHETGATFAPEWNSWLYICLHDTTTKCHAGASHSSVSSPWFFYWGENFTPVRNLAAVSCKREMTSRFGVKSVCW